MSSWLNMSRIVTNEILCRPSRDSLDWMLDRELSNDSRLYSLRNKKINFKKVKIDKKHIFSLKIYLFGYK